MNSNTATNRDTLRRLEPDALMRHQLERLNDLLGRILPENRFYEGKLSDIERPITCLEKLAELPFTFKDELIGTSEQGDLAQNRTYPLDKYVRFHRTSGTRGRPMVVLDTAEDWQWWLDGWQYVLDAAGVTAEDRAFMAFGFGPFVGFWSAFDAAVARGCLSIPSGGLSTIARLELIQQNRATVVFCTPTYALHMANQAKDHQVDLEDLAVKKLILAGEPGGSIPEIRQQIEAAWHAKVYDHTGATEIGPWGFPDKARQGVLINEAMFLPEFLSLKTGKSAGEGELSELVITTLGRAGCPVIRYRTGDLVRPRWNHPDPCNFVLLEGGVLGRVDDMLVIRGVNVFPTSIEQILRGFPEVVEYRMTAHKRGAMDAVKVEIEDRKQDAQRVARELELRLGLKFEVELVEIGTLPRFEGKGRRFIDNRDEGDG